MHTDGGRRTAMGGYRSFVFILRNAQEKIHPRIIVLVSTRRVLHRPAGPATTVTVPCSDTSSWIRGSCARPNVAVKFAFLLERMLFPSTLASLHEDFNPCLSGLLQQAVELGVAPSTVDDAVCTLPSTVENAMTNRSTAVTT